MLPNTYKNNHDKGFFRPTLATLAFSSLFMVLGSIGLIAQDLTITTSGETGTSSTKWSISGNTLTVSSTGTVPRIGSRAWLCERKIVDLGKAVMNQTILFGSSPI